MSEPNLRYQKPETSYQSVKKFFSFWLLVIGIWFLSVLNLHAEDLGQVISDTTSDVVDTLQNATADVQENSVPLFDPQLFDAQNKLLPRDKFLAKIQKQRDDFNKKQRENRLEFIRKVREQDLSSEATQAKIRDFRNNENEDQKNFFAKQQEKIQKYHEDQEDKKAKGLNKDDFFTLLARSRAKFQKDQGNRKKDFLEEFNKERISGKLSPEDIPSKLQKFSEAQFKRQQKFNDEQREQIEKKLDSVPVP